MKHRWPLSNSYLDGTVTPSHFPLIIRYNRVHSVIWFVSFSFIHCLCCGNILCQNKFVDILAEKITERTTAYAEFFLFICVFLKRLWWFFKVNYFITFVWFRNCYEKNFQKILFLLHKYILKTSSLTYSIYLILLFWLSRQYFWTIHLHAKHLSIWQPSIRRPESQTHKMGILKSYLMKMVTEISLKPTTVI